MKTKKMVFLGLMVGYSLILYILETYIPNPFIVFFPGAKLGLTNIITLVSLLIFGFKETFIIVTVRVILSSIFAGPMSYLLFSIGGAYLSLIVMFLVNKIKGFSVIGVSIAGAIAHNIGQLLVASILVENFLMITYLPFMLATSLVTGLFVGIVSQFCYSKMDRIKDSFINMRQ
ncbi:MAG: Gx transporter family protein [Clostridiales bacterium]|jgi:heptaprenyl diphosphate synthase|uniref:Gx transporter family protein n=1 Tax=Clostridia TaxID=186801 RepID=UPI0018ABBB0F|nr:Gx transporter family protein [Clostridium sp. 1001270J_160509_D11]MDU1202813.1 Gx transporter family protein [Clostridiales bacterium]